ncbi:hypothetical protein [Sphingopyxis flava]|uniref:DUF4398 domain-containing protein n=1 Tax=Sphingopyxis flava TaxID=1507287 RepID=A0A1T5DI93_9SPHN|nr:hypothetical protein [Sphingopyxis flava]SKB71291.1 hypothetical protein SAMN06295937_1014108 [Sphingopyxis flava]
MAWRTARTFLLALLLISASACSRTENEPGPGGVTVSEAKALDQAAEMLESRDPPPLAGHDQAAGESAR